MKLAIGVERRWTEALFEHETVVRAFLAKCRAIPEADWHRPEVPGKWSPAAVILHVCRTYELGRDAAAGGTGMRLLVAPSTAWLARTILLPFLLATTRFPQGANAPAEVVPDLAEARMMSPDAAAARLLHATQEAATALRRAGGEHQVLRITHAYFGPLHPRSTLRLLSAHTRHHTRLLGGHAS